ncbi:hypothetical protein MPH47_09820 [Psychrobacillus psychrodurans]|uniref:hypothetical protein n=1 Tax=Psychrobacillus psychrodurans TaxID=126157 RepID=UPI001F4D7235|nr:hypothetical protein [Psychrobacillus psychrodurans]MCK1997514.1 hypothetical protein [Psychrobacillus psychrodurans]
MEKQYFNLMQFFEGYVRNYRRMNLSQLHNRSMFTKREIDYFANLGEILGFDAFVEDSKFDKTKGRSRPMDLSWWKWDARIDDEHFLCLALHLERENVWSKDVDTIEKLFSQTEEGYIPHNVIGIQFIESADKIGFLNSLIIQKNAIQNSNALMVYRYYDAELEIERVCAYSFSPKGLSEIRTAICKKDDSGYWYMSFDEEYAPFQDKDLTNLELKR